MGIMLNAWKTLPFPTQAGQVGGHEGVGKIVKMGPGTDNAAVKLGDRVGIKWMSGICEACEACRAGMDACCFNGVRIPPFTHQFIAVRLITRTESLGLLHPGHLPAVRPRPRKLRHPHPRRPRLCSRRAPALCRCDRVRSTAQDQRRERQLRRHHGCGWWTGSSCCTCSSILLFSCM